MSTLTSFLTGIANAIRGKTGETGTISASLFAEKIAAIETGIDTSDATAGASDIKSGKTAYAKGSKITGTHTCPTLSSMTSDATATASDISYGKTAYVNGSKITGTNNLSDLTDTLVRIANNSSFTRYFVYTQTGSSTAQGVLLNSGTNSIPDVNLKERFFISSNGADIDCPTACTFTSSMLLMQTW